MDAMTGWLLTLMTIASLAWTGMALAALAALFVRR
jgi:hypothetical protein